MNTNTQELLFEYVTITESKEYKDAERMVKNMEKKLERIKAEFKKAGLTEGTVEKDKKKAILRFTVGTMERVDTVSIPSEIRDRYLKTSEVWRKSTFLLTE